MTDITKKVNFGKPAAYRTQTFTDSDASAGDILLVSDSLGYPASYISIEAGDTMQVRLNVKTQIVVQNHAPENFHYHAYQFGIHETVDYTDESGGIITLAANETLVLDGDLPINDIQLVTVSGTFDIFVS